MEVVAEYVAMFQPQQEEKTENNAENLNRRNTDLFNLNNIIFHILIGIFLPFNLMRTIQCN